MNKVKGWKRLVEWHTPPVRAYTVSEKRINKGLWRCNVTDSPNRPQVPGKLRPTHHVIWSHYLSLTAFVICVLLSYISTLMSSKRPLSYQNWKCVIKYMNSNTRILLSQHCPELRLIEKSIPLKIHSLELRCQDLIVLNDSTYQVGIIRQYHDETYEIPEEIQWFNNNGGMRHDADKYGLRLTPGYPRMDRDYQEREKKMLQKRIEQLKEQLPGSATLLEHAEKNLKHRDHAIFLYDLQSKNLEPPFTHYLQLTITSKTNGTQRNERLVYNQKLQLAHKYLIDKLFGGRTQILIGHMGVYSSDQLFPRGSLMRVQNLTIEYYSIVPFLAKVLDYKNYPLETLSLRGEELNNPIAATAQKLLFTGLSSGFPVIRHENVEFSCYFDITASVQRLVQHMLSVKTSIGVCYAFRCDFDFEKTELIDEIKETNEEKVKLFMNTRNDTFSSCVVLQMTETSDLFVYWTNEKMNYLKIEVLPSGSPVSIEHD
ncbi:hypothetical protein GCK72_007667 [Caenorhabditis remanei]|uniref:Uncharacterized protein n=1 Tax=Caenorhabditis remanei TaxID=31234 RepID=A0A6A5HIK9_CAERE|nr:hypothetical protein GCK72_007667 [Caenorhabditis remanei]KAF1767708.1 hypothetical protein GCK72_007667 [Caenorhabditis remanei]